MHNEGRGWCWNFCQGDGVQLCNSVEPELSLLTGCRQRVPSPLLGWLPVILGLSASVGVAWLLCPVPLPHTVSPIGAVLLAARYVILTVSISTAVLTITAKFAARHLGAVATQLVLPIFCCTAAWMTPAVAFYLRNSLWMAGMGLISAGLISKLVYRYAAALYWAEMPMQAEEPRSAQTDQAGRFLWIWCAAVLLHAAAICLLASMARPASILIASAIAIVFVLRQTALPARRNREQPNLSRSVALPAIAVSLAMVFVVASLTPYLGVPDSERDTAGGGDAGTRPAADWALRRSHPNRARGQYRGRTEDGKSTEQQRYPVLQALFGEGHTEAAKSAEPSTTRNLTMLVSGDSVAGVILRPEVDEHVTLVPPLPAHSVFGRKMEARKTDPITIPFFGAYWYFRSSDKGLPANAVETRGNPAFLTFKTTDFSPISMEARQNFGSVINLSCCQAIEVVIANGDRRPDTVQMELILSNTTLPGRPHQSLGLLPVKSTERGTSGDDRRPVSEALRFQFPEQAAMGGFDEVIVRFHLYFLRDEWSAKIAIEKFRIIPRGI